MCNNVGEAPNTGTEAAAHGKKDKCEKDTEVTSTPNPTGKIVKTQTQPQQPKTM